MKPGKESEIEAVQEHRPPQTRVPLPPHVQAPPAFPSLRVQAPPPSRLGLGEAWRCPCFRALKGLHRDPFGTSHWQAV